MISRFEKTYLLSLWRSNALQSLPLSYLSHTQFVTNRLATNFCKLSIMSHCKNAQKRKKKLNHFDQYLAINYCRTLEQQVKKHHKPHAILQRYVLRIPNQYSLQKNSDRSAPPTFTNNTVKNKQRALTKHLRVSDS